VRCCLIYVGQWDVSAAAKYLKIRLFQSFDRWKSKLINRFGAVFGLSGSSDQVYGKPTVCRKRKSFNYLPVFSLPAAYEKVMVFVRRRFLGPHSLYRGRSGQGEIWVADPEGSNAVQLTSLAAVSGAPCWAPDGERIVFQSNPEGQFEVYVIPATGGKPRNLTSHEAIDVRPSFSRDGQWIYFTSNRTGQLQIWKMPASGGDAVQLTSNGAFAAFESPDGAYVYLQPDYGEAEPVVASASFRWCPGQGGGRRRESCI
jgi:hypothetical protein